MRCCRFPYYDRHRQAPHRDTDKQSSPHLQVYEQRFFIPFSTMACRVIPTAEQNWRFCRKRESEDSFTNFLFSCKAEALLNKDKKSDLNMQRRGLVCPDYFRLPYLSYGTFLPFFSPMKPDDDTDTILPIASTGFCAYLSSFTL